MTNTTEEIIRTIRKGFITENRSTVCNEIPFVADAVDYTVERVFALPLADRLTPEEKERVRAIYNRKRFGTEYSNEVKWMEKQLLEHLFGKDFFKEEE